MNNDITFGSIVKERRQLLGLTQAELGRRVGCAAITIRKIEADALRPSVQIAEHLATALDIPAKEQLAFVRLARSDPDPSPLPAPKPIPAEIGQADLSGRAIRGYELGQRIAVGGFGAVYRAIQPQIEREVAIKIILPQYADHPDFIRRFEAEAQLVAQLEHPFIVPLYDYWREPGIAHLVMRLMRGGSLQTRLKDGPLALETTWRLLQQIGDALHSAHRAGIVHRDIKPANILLDEDGNAYLADFGFAKNLGNPNLAEQTQAGTIVGSLEYISPEQLQAEPVKPQSDIYCLGIVLYEMLTGRKPFRGKTLVDYIQLHLREPLPFLSAHHPDPDVDQELVAALEAVLARATAKNPAERYPDVMALLADFQQSSPSPATAAMVDFRPVSPDGRPSTAGGQRVDLDNPYKGLRAFSEADAADFFGRDTLIQSLLARLAESHDLARFLAVIGPSGSGKSSVVRAGLLPLLRQGGLPGSEDWFIVEMLPGRQPLEELEAALLRVAINPPQSLLAQLREDERGLHRAVRRILPAAETTELVLVIDQFEELFILCSDETVRAHFLDSLVTAILDPASRLRVVVTLRADFTDRPLQYVDFGELVHRRTEFVLPLTPDELAEAITKPTERAGLILEPGLPSTIISDLGDQPGTLPLLQYTLTELFERRVGNALTLGAYQASGGVRGALASRANELYTALDRAGQAAARQLFLRLITLGEMTGDGLPAPDTRRRVLRSELSSLVIGHSSLAPGQIQATANKQMTNDRGQVTIESIIDTFGRHRLLTFDRDPVTRGPTVEVAHEALIREWDRLRQWLDKDREFLLWQQRLRAGLHQWATSEQDEGALLRGAPLAEAENWLNRRRGHLNEAEREFIQAGLALREREAAERETQLRRELEVAHELAKETEARRQAEEQHAQEAEARAQEQAQAAANLRKRAVWLAGVGVMAVLLAVAAGMFGVQSSQNAEQALLAEQTAEARRRQAETAQAKSEAAQMEAERQARRATASQLAAQAQNVLESGEDLSGTLALLLAREAVLTTLTQDGYFTPEADAALRQVVDSVPVLLKTFSGHTDGIWAAAFSPDGQTVVTGADDRSVRLWDVSTGEEIRRFEGHQDFLNSAAFSPGGQSIITTSNDRTARLWNVATGEEIYRLELTNNVNSAAFSPDGQVLATGDRDRFIRLWQVSSGKEIRRFEGQTGEIWGIAFSRDGKTLVSAGDDRTARLWNVTTGEEIRRFEGHENGPNSVAFSPDEKSIITAGGDNTIRIWDVATGQEIRRVDLPKSNTEAASTLVRAVLSPDGQTIVTSGVIGARVWNATTGEEVQHLVGHTAAVLRVAYSSNGQMIVTTGERPDNTARLWAAYPKGATRHLQGHRNPVRSVAVSPDGQTIATSGDDKTVRLWDATTGKEITQLEGHTGRVNAVAFSPDRHILASTGFDKTIRLWDLPTKQEINRFAGHEGTILSLAFSPDGLSMATAGEDKTARLWDVKTGQEIRRFTGHTSSVNAVAFSSDNQTIVTGGADKTVRVWNVATGEEIRRLEGHTLFVLSVDFSPDGQTILSAGSDNTVRLWACR